MIIFIPKWIIICLVVVIGLPTIIGILISIFIAWNLRHTKWWV